MKLALKGFTLFAVLRLVSLIDHDLLKVKPYHLSVGKIHIRSFFPIDSSIYSNVKISSNLALHFVWTPAQSLWVRHFCRKDEFA